MDVAAGQRVVTAHWRNVVESELCTVIANEHGVTVRTVEHLLAALRGCDIDNAVIELDVMSKSAAGDIKLEVWGDGQSYATSRGAYLATSYVFIFGGWGNSVSALCRK